MRREIGDTNDDDDAALLPAGPKSGDGMEWRQKNEEKKQTIFKDRSKRSAAAPTNERWNYSDQMEIILSSWLYVVRLYTK